jgi:hypothetical protein
MIIQILVVVVVVVGGFFCLQKDTNVCYAAMIRKEIDKHIPI